MSSPNILGENIKAMEELRSKFQNCQLPKISTGIVNNIDFEKFKNINNTASKPPIVKNPLIDYVKEQNDSLKILVKYNEDISRYNKELVSLNEKILNKINSLDDTLTFLNGAFSDKAKKDNKNSEQQLSLLLELITIIEDKDSSKLETFMSNIGAPVAVGLLIEVLKVKFGLG